MPPTSLPRIGLIGVSGYSEVYLDLLLAAENRERCQLVAATALPREQDSPYLPRLRERGVRLHPSFKRFIAEEAGRLDLCIIPTPIHWHARMAVAALRAGMHVLVEKPLAGSLSDAESILHAEAESGRWVAVGFQDIYTPEIAWLKQRLLAGHIGPLASVKVIGLWPRSDAYYARNQWAGRLFVEGAAAFDSPLNNAFAHFVNLALFLAGPTFAASTPVQVLSADLYRARPIESFDTAVVTARAASGVRFWFGVSHASAVYREPEVHLEGASGQASWLHHRLVRIAPAGGPEESLPLHDYDSTRQSMLAAVLHRLANPAAFVCGSSLALCHTQFIQDVHALSSIRNVDPARIEVARVPGHDNPVPAIRQIDRLLDQAMLREGLLPASPLPETPALLP